MTKPPKPTVKTPGVNWHFAVPVFSAALPGFEEHQQGLIDLILKRKAESQGVKFSNLNGWHSENRLQHWKSPHIQWFVENLGEFARNSLTRFNKNTVSQDIILQAAWANVSGHGAWNAPHSHLPALWSGVFYVSAEDSFTKIPGKPKPSESPHNSKLEFLNPCQVGGYFGMESTALYTPENGMALLFPGFLQHMVHPNLTQVDRISIAFNMMLREPPRKKS